MGFSFISMLGNANGSCPWLKQPIPCDFALYTSNQSLAADQKLLPNTDITGTGILITFIVITFASCLLSWILIGDEVCLAKGIWSHQSYKHRFYAGLRHGMDTTLHSLSDSQILAGLALLAVAALHNNCISAYHYNVVCYLVVMSIMTHALVFVNVPGFFTKNVFVGSARVLLIVISFVLTVLIFYTRNKAQDFPIVASSSMIMPASCFEKAAANSPVVGNSSTTATILTSRQVSTTTDNTDDGQLAILGVVAVSFVLGLISLFIDSVYRRPSDGPPPYHSHFHMMVALLARAIITFAITVAAILATKDYFDLKNGFEIEGWYTKTLEDTASVGQVLTIMLTMAPVLAVLGICGKVIEGPRGVDHVNKIISVIRREKRGSDPEGTSDDNDDGYDMDDN